MYNHNKLTILNGDKYNNLTIIKEDQPIGRLRKFMCRCVCGNKRSVYMSALRSGNTKSCGCITIIKTHGMSRTRQYSIWKTMRKRCLSEKNMSYQNYGGRGIEVCEEWSNSFETFWKDMQIGYSDSLTLDRIDNDGNYTPENCRWATIVEQQNNTRKNRILTYKGKKLTVAQWSRKLNIPANTIHSRIFYKKPIDIILKEYKLNN